MSKTPRTEALRADHVSRWGSAWLSDCIGYSELSRLAFALERELAKANARAERLERNAKENCEAGKHRFTEVRSGTVCIYCGTVK